MINIKIYNTLTRQKEEFIPITKNEVKIYACGPTVYNFIHIGNARPLCVFDVLRRYLEYKGYKVDFVQNFTDIDDKIINKANAEHTDFLTIAERYIKEYKQDAKGLNIKEATIAPLATQNIENMQNMISELISKGYAYAAKNGDVYFSSKKFKEYGKLSGQPLEDLESGARISVEESKKDPLDFVLWKSSKPGEPFWESPWGQGRPGWHIECSAMARRYLGNTIDIHAGGQDLIFPHHENEIAQSECCTNKPFANYWMHNGYINIDNKKMSKSLNNFFTVREIAKEFGYEPIRFLMLSSHYRSPVNFSKEILDQCKNSLGRFYSCKENLEFLINKANIEKNEEDEILKEQLLKHKQTFLRAMEDDLNTADAISSIFELIRQINVEITNVKTPSLNILKFALDLFIELTSVLGFNFSQKHNLEEDIENLIKEREIARKNKDFNLADRIRDMLKAKGIVVEDTAQGIKWHMQR